MSQNDNQQRSAEQRTVTDRTPREPKLNLNFPPGAQPDISKAAWLVMNLGMRELKFMHSSGEPERCLLLERASRANVQCMPATIW